MRKKNRFRALRNLAIAALLLVFIWYLGGCPLPTLEMELHRAERQALAEESRVVWAYQGKQYNDRDILVGLAGSSVHTYSQFGRLALWPRSVEEPTLVVLPERTRYAVQGGSYLAPAFLAVDPPARAESARLTMDLNGVVVWSSPVEPYVMGGEKAGGVFFFQLDYQHTSSQSSALSDDEATAFSVLYFHPEPNTLAYCPYTLEFFDATGELLQTVSN